jgi:glycosyltransferase involved in cell wall biosynthesis
MAERVTVCIPTYARTRWLAEAIESVLAQTFRDFVLLVVDDATPGDTVRPVVERFDDPRIRFVRFEENAGIVGNFNRTLWMSETDYVLQVGDDDAIHPGLLEATVKTLDEHPRAGFVHTQFDRIDAEGRVVQADVNMTGDLHEDTVEPGAVFVRKSMLRSWSPVCTSSALLRRAAMPEWGFREEFAPAFDFGCWLEVARDWDVAFLARNLCRYRVHDRSFTAGGENPAETGYLRGLTNLREIRRVKLAFLERHYPPGSERRELARLAKRDLRRELVTRVRMDTVPARRLVPTARGLATVARAEWSVLLEPAAWALLAGGVVGQRGVDMLRRRLPNRPL